MNDTKEIHGVFLIADLSGYTALTEAHGNISAAQIVKRYVEIVKECLLKDSQLVETVGDEVLIVGTDAPNLIQVGLRLREKVEKEPNFPAVHIGIHAGYVLEQDGKYFGSAVNVASRTAAHARAGQILCTDSIIELINDAETISYQPLGEVHFKNIVEPIFLFEIAAGPSAQSSNLTDPVCQMQVKPDTAHGRLNYQGQNYFFCSFECARTFAIQPERYLK
jgi:class 3 adenylate cyclase/YHS domain-containing protein